MMSVPAHANFERLLAVRPTVLKLDISLITGLSQDSWKREVVGGLVLLAQRIGSLVLAEGAEEHADIMTALELGVDLFQGFYFAKPGGSFDSVEAPGGSCRGSSERVYRANLGCCSVFLGTSRMDVSVCAQAVFANSLSF